MRRPAQPEQTMPVTAQAAGAQARRLRWWLPAAWAAAALLGACGGGGGDDSSSTPPGALSVVPDSANASSAAYTAFTASLVGDGARADAWTPLQMNQARAPSSEVDPPATVR